MACLCVSIQKLPDSVRLPERFVYLETHLQIQNVSAGKSFYCRMFLSTECKNLLHNSLHKCIIHYFHLVLCDLNNVCKVLSKKTSTIN